jgi:LmbE family N-acetylglucosaminyl deacetylase/CheY-like chemotaxis protein
VPEGAEVTSSALRVVVLDDDPDVADFTRTVLEKRAGCEVITLGDASQAAAAVARFDPDVVLTDIEMPGMTGLELVALLRARDATVKVVVMTAHGSVDYAVAALRQRVDEFLLKPVEAARLVEVVQRLGAQRRAARAARPGEVVLAVGAHPDDVEIAVGATLVAHRAATDTVVILTLSGGARGGESGGRQLESLAAAELLGARLFLEDLMDTQIPAAGPTVDIIERIVREVHPTIVYTHSRHDRHQDHRAVHDATMVSTRTVRTVACYQSPSATVDFRPNRFVSVDGFVEGKLALLRCFASQVEIRSYMQSDLVLATARYWSRFGTGTEAEPLEIVRDSSGIGRAGGAGWAVGEDRTADSATER